MIRRLPPPAIRLGILAVACWLGSWAVGAAVWFTGAPPALVKVRWDPALGADRRASHEAAYSLTEPEFDDGTTYRYVLRDVSQANIRRLVHDPAVLDTHHIDRATYRIVPTASRPAGRGFAWLFASLRNVLAALGTVAITAAMAIVLFGSWGRRVRWFAPPGALAAEGRAVTIVPAQVIGLACALVAGAGAGLFRFLAFRGLPNDHYMHLAWAQQLLRGALPGRDFIEPGMPLTVGLSALAQLWWPGPFGEGVLCILALGLAAAATCHVISAVAGSRLAGLVGAAVQTAFFPRLYGYPKLLVPAVALLLMLRYARADGRSTSAVALLSAWTVVAFLLRHDLGVMTALAVACGIASASTPWKARCTDLFRYVTLGLALVSPYVFYIQWTEGLAEHVRAGVEFGRSDAHQFLITRVPAPWSGGAPAWDAPAATWLLWLAHAVLVAVLWRAHRQRSDRCAPVVISTLVFLVLYRLVIIRHPLDSRLPDAAAVLTFAGAWCVMGSNLRRRASLTHRLAPAAATLVLASVALAAAWQVAGLAGEMGRTGLLRGWPGISLRAGHVIATARQPDWRAYWPAGEMPDLVEYIRSCTPRDAYLLMTWSAPEFYVFAGRRFASGQFLFTPRSFSSARDEDLMLRRLERERPPVALVNETRLVEFSLGFPAVHAWIAEHYIPAGQATIRGDEVVVIAIRRGLVARHRYGSAGWPCGFE